MNFLVFGGSHYYPKGGFNDFRGGYASLKEAQAFADQMLADEENEFYDVDWWHIVETINFTIIARSKEDHGAT